MVDALLEAAQIIADVPATEPPAPEMIEREAEAWTEAFVHHHPGSVVQIPTWTRQRPGPPSLDSLDSSDELVVPRAESPSSRQYTRCPETHNEVEKRRRAYLTQCYIELQNVVPIISDCKASNVTVLKHATDYILKLQHDFQRFENAKNAHLRRRAELLSRMSVARAYVKVAPFAASYYALPTFADAYRSSPGSPRGHPQFWAPQQRDAGNETETDEEEDLVVPDPRSHGANPWAPAVGLTELTNAMAHSAQRKQRTQIRTRNLGDFGNGHPGPGFAGKFYGRPAVHHPIY
eukprot:m.58260 g.58260  ORF g.58260 m.58260 type:complete len:291 (-) comp17210_c0_seq2:238-1110(-)